MDVRVSRAADTVAGIVCGVVVSVCLVYGTALVWAVHGPPLALAGAVGALALLVRGWVRRRDRITGALVGTVAVVVPPLAAVTAWVVHVVAHAHFG